MIYIDPSEQRSTSLFPQDINVIPCPGLEEKTGADFVISLLPFSPTFNLQTHIDNLSIFVQAKFGGDITSFDSLHHAIARMKKCEIPAEQSLLLAIVQDDMASDGSLSINGGIFSLNPTQYASWQTAKAEWRLLRGGSFDQIPNRACLSVWIESQQKAIIRARYDGIKYIYSPPTQLYEEMDKDDLRFILCRGLTGPVLAENIVQTLDAKKWPRDLFHALALLSFATGKKRDYKVPGFGKASFLRLRRLLGLPTGCNLGILPDRKGDDELIKGANIALEMIGRELESYLKSDASIDEKFMLVSRKINEFFIGKE